MLIGASSLASAVLVLPTPVCESTVNDGNVKVTWTFESEDAPSPIFHVIVFKQHTATAYETFVLGQSNFDYIESTGTLTKHEERGAIWDYLPDNAGWYVKYPQYMNGAMGIDTFNYYPGADNDDIFGGAYIISPDYDLSNLSDPNITIQADMANEAISVSGGYVIYNYSTDWWSENNYDYKPNLECDVFHEDLTSDRFKSYEDVLYPFEELNRTRVCFYGTGRSALWIDSFKATVNMKAGETITYPADMHRITDGSKEYTIDTTGDNANDKTVGYQVLASREDYDDYRQLTTIRFMSAMNKPMIKVGEGSSSGIDGIAADTDAPTVTATNGTVTVTGVDNVQIFSTDGRMVYNGAADSPIALGAKGIYIVRAGSRSVKVIL